MKYMIVTVVLLVYKATSYLTIKVEQQMRLGTVDIQKPLWRVSRYREKKL